MKATTCRAFTLIELLIVVAIIAILAAIAVPNFLEAQTRARTSRSKADMRTLATAFEAYRVDWTNYPESNIFQGETSERNFPTTIPRNKLGGVLEVTTPVAYITRYPRDVFPITFPLSSNPTINAEISGRQDYPIYYLNLINYISGYPGLRETGGAWVLHSTGPLGKFPSSTGPTGLVTVYDPTNGTVSEGSISRTGPGNVPYYNTN
jgi:type II secretion system protein G